jgi:hypothetical protein
MSLLKLMPALATSPSVLAVVSHGNQGSIGSNLEVETVEIFVSI